MEKEYLQVFRMMCRMAVIVTNLCMKTCFVRKLIDFAIWLWYTEQDTIISFMCSLGKWGMKDSRKIKAWEFPRGHFIIGRWLYMPGGLEITQRAIEDFAKVQENMMLAKEENATRTYANLKKEYISLKALLMVAGVNLTELDRIKE